MLAARSVGYGESPNVRMDEWTKGIWRNCKCITRLGGRVDATTLIRNSILLSMMLLVAAVGMRSAGSDATYLIRRPGLFLRSVLAMSVILPVLTVGLVVLLDLRPAVRIALVALSLSPVPPFLPDKLLKIEHNRGYVYALFASASLISIVLIPATTTLLVAHFGVTQHIGAAKVFGIVAPTVLVPLALGAGVRYLWPGTASRLNSWLSIVGGILLVAASIPILFSQWPSIRELLGDGTLLAIAAFTVAGLLIGHLSGGPDPDDRGVLALATASRHPAVAIAIGAASYPNQPLVPAAILLALATGMIVSAPYSAWRKRVHASLFGPSIRRPGERPQ